MYVGRSKDIIRRGGVTVVPTELEPVLMRHPAVQEAAVVPLPDERLGERACAALILRPGSGRRRSPSCRSSSSARASPSTCGRVGRGLRRVPAHAVAEGGQARGRQADRQPAPASRPPSDGFQAREILAAATERFGRDGYEDTKWADIAADVGVGPTALYHYFESKQHCLYVIMDQAIEGFRSRFEELTAGSADPLERLIAVIDDCFRLSERDIQRNRVLVAEQGLLSARSDSPREEQARQDARAHARPEFAWASFLSHAMQQGAIPKNDPRLLTRAILGLYNSIWHWYRPNGIVALNRSPSSSPTAASP